VRPAGPRAGQGWDLQIQTEIENGERAGATGIEPGTAIQTIDHSAQTPPVNNTHIYFTLNLFIKSIIKQNVQIDKQ
jgi:hypothetical protein